MFSNEFFYLKFLLEKLQLFATRCRTIEYEDFYLNFFFKLKKFNKISNFHTLNTNVYTQSSLSMILKQTHKDVKKKIVFRERRKNTERHLKHLNFFFKQNCKKKRG